MPVAIIAVAIVFVYLAYLLVKKNAKVLAVEAQKKISAVDGTKVREDFAKARVEPLAASIYEHLEEGWLQSFRVDTIELLVAEIYGLGDDELSLLNNIYNQKYAKGANTLQSVVGDISDWWLSDLAEDQKGNIIVRLSKLSA